MSHVIFVIPVKTFKEKKTNRENNFFYHKLLKYGVSYQFRIYMIDLDDFKEKKNKGLIAKSYSSIIAPKKIFFCLASTQF